MLTRLRQSAASLARRIKNASIAFAEAWDKDLQDVFFGPAAASGERVNERTALGLSTYFACIRNISEDEAKLPLNIYQKLDPRGRKPLPNHYLSQILQGEANPEMSSFSFRQTLMVHALGWHGGFAEIVRDTNGVPIELWPLDPTACAVQRDPWGEKLLYYRIHGKPMAQRDIFHLHGMGYSGVAGLCLAWLARDPLGNALAAQKFTGSFFGNGTTTSGIIEVPDAMSEKAFKHLRESFFERHGGSESQWKPIILEEGAKYTPTSTEPEKSQLLETLQFGIEEVCRLFRMPPHKVQHLLRATFSNIEMQALEYVTDCLLGWLVRFEQEISRKLLFPKERKTVFAKHNLDMLLRGDTAARTAFYREMFNIGAFSDNDIREKEDQNPIDGGDTYFVNAALVPLEMAATGEHLQQNQPESPPSKPAKPGPTESDGGSAPSNEHRSEIMGRIAAAHTKAIEGIISGLLRVERDNVMRAAKKTGFEPWVTDFYRKSHQKEVAKRLKPAIGSLTASLDAILETAGHD